MDEPCSSLDPISTNLIEELIKSYKDKYTLIIVTHNLAQARRVCDYTTVLWYDDTQGWGIEIETDRSQVIFENPKHQIVKDYIGGLKG